MSVVGGEAFDVECILNKRPEKELVLATTESSSSVGSEATVRPTVTLEELKSSIAEMGENFSESTISRSLRKAGLYCTVDLVPVKTESRISVSSPDDDVSSAKKVKLDGNTCASDTVLQTKEQTAEAKEPVKKKRGRKPLPPELRAKKFLKTPSKALPRQAKPAIKKPLLPDSFRGITRSSRNLLDVPSGQSSSSSGQGQGAPHASAGSLNGRQTSKKSKELPVKLRDKIVQRHISGDGYKKISRSLNISSSTVESIIRKWKVHRTTETLPRSGCPSKLSNQARNRLVSEATVRPTVTLKELKSSIAEMGVNVSESTISRSLHKAGLYWTVELGPATTESSSSISAPDDDISCKMVKPDGNTCVSDTLPQTTEQTAELREEPVKKKRGRKPLPPELRAKKLLKTPSKALPRQPKPAIKKPLLPGRLTRSSRELLDVPSGQSSSSSGQGQGAPQASAGSPNGQKKSKKSKELPVKLRDKIVQRHISGEGYKTISKSLNISSSTIGSIIRKWKVHRTTETLPRSGCPSKLNNQARNRLVSEATVRPTVTLKELKSSIAEMGVNVCESTISRSLHKAGLYWSLELGPAATESSSSLASPDDDISAEMVKPDSQACATPLVPQNNAQTLVARVEAVNKKRGRKSLPPEPRVEKLLKTPSKALPRQPKLSIKRTLLPDRFTGITRSSRDPLDVLSGQSSSSGQDQGAPQVPTGSPNGRQTAKKSKELPVELRDKIIERHKSGEGYRKISTSLNISSSTVASIILKWKVHHTTATLPRSGRPSKLSNQARNRLAQ
ncbi:uncharacterized protein LOC133122096 isoform X2 [Conger conger]|uniref:uncharacterized protein LOC133122096 isoform X2 n=1 Tax=Conger conger TaxID=82655 RepID=UPI002A5A4866|nr:uncharacterized protein LOC133122096 isoform X2 [Conger conger]